MSAAPQEILARIRAATGPAASAADVNAAYAALPRAYRLAHHDPSAADVVALFAGRAADYRAVVERVPADGLPGAIARVLADIPGSRSPTACRSSGWPGCPAPPPAGPVARADGSESSVTTRRFPRGSLTRSPPW